MSQSFRRGSTELRALLPLSIVLVLGAAVTPAVLAERVVVAAGAPKRNPVFPAVPKADASPQAQGNRDAAATASASTPEIIFADGFESGDLSAWFGGGAACTSSLRLATSLRD